MAGASQPVSHRRAAAEEKKLPIVYLRIDIEWGKRHYRKCRDIDNAWYVHSPEAKAMPGRTVKQEQKLSSRIVLY